MLASRTPWLPRHRGGTKPATVKIAQAERQMEEGTEALGRTRAELARIKEERTRLEELLAQAPMPLDEMERRHGELVALNR